MSSAWNRGRLLVATAILAWSGHAPAQYPNRPLRLVVPFPPGGLLDNLARALSPGMAAQLGQPDGHTLLIGGGSSFAVAPLPNRASGFDPLRDLAPVSMVSRGPMVLVTRPSFEAGSVAALVAMARAAAAKLSYGTPGNGNPNHFSGELFKAAAQIDLVHVPYKGAAFVITDVIAGHVPVGFVTLGAAMSQVNLADWSAVFVPSGTPRDAIARLSEVVQRSLAANDLRAPLKEQGLEAQGSTPAQLAAQLQSDVARLGKVVREAGIKAD